MVFCLTRSSSKHAGLPSELITDVRPVQFSNDITYRLDDPQTMRQILAENPGNNNNNNNGDDDDNNKHKLALVIIIFIVRGYLVFLICAFYLRPTAWL